MSSFAHTQAHNVSCLISADCTNSLPHLLFVTHHTSIHSLQDHGPWRHRARSSSDKNATSLPIGTSRGALRGSLKAVGWPRTGDFAGVVGGRLGCQFHRSDLPRSHGQVGMAAQVKAQQRRLHKNKPHQYQVGIKSLQNTHI